MHGQLGHETSMARNIDAVTKDFNGAVIVLIGASHATLNPRGSAKVGGSAATEIQERPPFVLKMLYKSGQIWANMYLSTGEVVPPPQKVSSFILVDGADQSFSLSSKDGYESGYYYTGTVSPSPPAFPSKPD